MEFRKTKIEVLLLHCLFNIYRNEKRKIEEINRNKGNIERFLVQRDRDKVKNNKIRNVFKRK